MIITLGGAREASSSMDGIAGSVILYRGKKIDS